MALAGEVWIRDGGLSGRRRWPSSVVEGSPGGGPAVGGGAARWGWRGQVANKGQGEGVGRACWRR
jgi:hypothetical protein